LFTLISISSSSQVLSKLGKIKVIELPKMPDHEVIKTGRDFKILTDSLTFDGNSYYIIPNGFITSLETVDNAKDYIKHYDSNGELIATIFTDRIINLKISKSGKYLAFNNTENIIYINLNNYNIDTLSGSFVYAFVNNEDLIYYSSNDKAIYYKSIRIDIEDYPNQFVDFKGKVYVITKHGIFELIGNSLFEKYRFRGKFFDAKIINDEFYFVDKIEKRKTEAFTLYKTSDFIKTIMIDKLDELNR
ncbi:MAG: hypothetical protein KAQ75_01750, partial [Bacteroidales bacterium]|nr:hypothetical protein [Bacteroidales bacterium]